MGGSGVVVAPRMPQRTMMNQLMARGERMRLCCIDSGSVSGRGKGGGGGGANKYGGKWGGMPIVAADRVIVGCRHESQADKMATSSLSGRRAEVHGEYSTEAHPSPVSWLLPG